MFPGGPRIQLPISNSIKMLTAMQNYGGLIRLINLHGKLSDTTKHVCTRDAPPPSDVFLLNISLKSLPLYSNISESYFNCNLSILISCLKSEVHTFCKKPYNGKSETSTVISRIFHSEETVEKLIHINI